MAGRAELDAAPRGRVEPTPAARLAGARDLWGHDAFFDRVGRWSEKEAPKGKDFYSYGPAPIKAL